LKRNLLSSLENVRLVTQNARDASSQIRRDLDDLLASSKGNFQNLGKKFNDVLDHIDTTIVDADTVVEKLTEQVTDPHLQQSLQETADLARTTLARFNQIASDLHELTGDPELQANLKQTVANLREATDRGQQAIKKVDTILDKVTGIGTGAKAPRLPKVDLVGNVSESLDPTRLRLDVDALVHLNQRDLLDLGLYDLGQDTRLTLQAGNKFSDDLTIRYGIYASKLGVGIDYQPLSLFGLRADLWDTNRPRLDVRGLFRVNRNASLWIGADSLLRTPVPILGVQLNH